MAINKIPKTSKKTLLWPLYAFIIYIIVSLCISLWGPAQYWNYNKVSVCVFMSLFLIIIFMGYLFGLHIKIPIYEQGENKHSYPLKLMKISLYISLIGVLMLIINDIVSGNFTFSLSSIGENYINRDTFKGNYDYPIAYMYRFVTGFFRYIAMTFPALYYKKLSKKYKMFFWLFIILYFIENCLLHGTQKVSLDIFLFAGIPFILRNKDKININKSTLFSILVVGSCLLLFLSYTQYTRSSMLGIDARNFGNYSNSGMYYNPDHMFFKIFGNELGFGLASILSGYFSAGYYGLSLCLSLPFEWTYGIGNSYALTQFINVLFGYDLYYDTYLYRMFQISGRDGLISWNTIFPWLASDFTFPGTLIISFFVGAIFAYTWKESYLYKNPIGLLFFLTIALGLIYVPANNQLFNGIDSFISTWIIIFVWWLKHRKYNRIN